MLAPIGISVYTRLEHFKKSICALQKNTLSAQSNLFVYSDAASCEADESLVSAVRVYANEIDGFKSVTVIERSKNFGGVLNAHLAVLQLVKVFREAIFIEDDIVTAPGFISFMNSALSYYRNNTDVISVSGYCPPIEAERFIDKE